MIFHIGQKVICINAGPINTVYRTAPPLTYGNRYTVRGIYHCYNCGHYNLDVGIPHDMVKDHICVCNIRIKTPVWWVSATRFAPIEEKSETDFFEMTKAMRITTVIAEVENGQKTKSDKQQAQG